MPNVEKTTAARKTEPGVLAPGQEPDPALTSLPAEDELAHVQARAAELKAEADELERRDAADPRDALRGRVAPDPVREGRIAAGIPVADPVEVVPPARRRTVSWAEHRATAERRLISAATAPTGPTPEQRTAVASNQAAAIEFMAALTSNVVPGRDLNIALTAVEDALMRANRGVFVDGTTV